jgi:hypothetical protein
MIVNGFFDVKPLFASVYVVTLYQPAGQQSSKKLQMPKQS